MWGTLNYHQRQSLCCLQLFQPSSNTGAEHHGAWSCNTSLVAAAFVWGPGLAFMCCPFSSPEPSVPFTNTQTCAPSLFSTIGVGSGPPLLPQTLPIVPLSPSRASSSPVIPGAGTPAHSEAAAPRELPETNSVAISNYLQRRRKEGD